MIYGVGGQRLVLLKDNRYERDQYEGIISSVRLSKDKRNVHESMLSLIGNTPLVKINSLNKNKDVKIYAKLESMNSTGSIKDRIALNMIEAAERSGELKEGMTIIEATSGNTGIGLALVGMIKGYKVMVTMSSAMSEERKKMLRIYGADIIETEPEKGTDGAIKKARELYSKDRKRFWMPNQFDNPENIMAHYDGTALEIIEQAPDVDFVIAALGTSGTLTGISRRLKEYNPKIKIVAVEPGIGHRIQGLKNMQEAIRPKIFDEKIYDQKELIEDDLAYETTRRLAKEEGIFAGMSSGAAMAIALKEAEKMKKGKKAKIVVILPDRGDKYLSTSLWDR